MRELRESGMQHEGITIDLDPPQKKRKKTI